MKRLSLLACLLAASATAVANEWDSEFEWYGFRISAGYQYAFDLKTSMDVKIPGGEYGKDAAYKRATGADGTYYSDDGGFLVKEDGMGSADSSSRWRAKADKATVGDPRTAVQFRNAFREAVSHGHDDEDGMHGAHIDLATTVVRDGDWGLDLFIGFSWMQRKDCYQASGTFKDNAGVYVTEADIETADLITSGDLISDGHGGFKPAGEWLGDGNDYSYTSPAINFNSIGAPKLVEGASTTYNASGDYTLYDIYGGMRLWYCDEALQWFKITSTIGCGVSYGDFDYQMSASGTDGFSIHESKSDKEWDFYGLLGLGFLLDLPCNFDASFDFLWRYAQDKHKIRGKYVSGEIEKPDFVLRGSLGYHF